MRRVVHSLLVAVGLAGCGGSQARSNSPLMLAADTSHASSHQVRISVSGEGELDVTLADPAGRRARCRIGQTPVNEIPGCHADIDYVHDVGETSPAAPMTMFELEHPSGGTWRLMVRAHAREQIQIQVESRLDAKRFCGAEDIVRAGAAGSQTWSLAWSSSPTDTCWVRAKRIAPPRPR
jgi:hypothetical protein